MAYCGPRGIPLSEFLRWDRKDQNAALTWQMHENRRCRSCGTHPDDWAEDKLAYHAHLAECPGCKQQQHRSKADPEAREGDGRFVVMQGGPAADCLQCRPLD